MSSTHEALSEAQENLPANQGSQRSVVSPGQFTDVKQVPRPSQKKRSAPSGSSPLFHPDPDENFRLWMQNCFPDFSLARADAIREWLARPVEARVQHGNNYGAKDATSNSSKTPVATPREATDTVHLNRRGARKGKWWLGWNSHRTDGSKEGPFADRSTLWMRRSLLKIVKYSFLAPLLLSGPLMGKRDSLADVTATTQLSKAEPTAASSAPQRQEPIEIKSDPAVPMIIESLSVGCEEAKPCIEISTRGTQTLPRLNTLSSPDRLVMDFQDTIFSSDVHRIPRGRGAIKAVRVGDGAEPANARVVIDLTEKCDYELYTLSNTVVLEVYRKGVPRPRGSSR